MNKEVNRCSDADLIRSVAGGRMDMFRVIVEKYLDMVARTSYRILCDRGAADEVTCSVFMSLWNDSASYDEVIDVKNTDIGFVNTGNENNNGIKACVSDCIEVTVGEKFNTPA